MDQKGTVFVKMLAMNTGSRADPKIRLIWHIVLRIADAGMKGAISFVKLQQVYLQANIAIVDTMRVSSCYRRLASIKLTPLLDTSLINTIHAVHDKA